MSIGGGGGGAGNAVPYIYIYDATTIQALFGGRCKPGLVPDAAQGETPKKAVIHLTITSPEGFLWF